ncbi:MAG: PH domain-containing protein [Candidatus Berkelbacteria bacterium]
MKKYFPNQKPEEKVLYVIRHHWFSFVPNVFFTFLIVLGLAIVSVIALANLISISGLNVEIFTIVLSMILLAAMVLTLHGFVDQYLDLFIITDERVIDIKQNGFFHQTTNELHLVDINDVETDISGAFGVSMKFGRLTIKTGAENEEMIIESVPRAAKVARMLMDLHTKMVSDDKKIDFDTLLIEGIPNCVLETTDDDFDEAKHSDEMQKDDAGYYFWTRLK